MEKLHKESTIEELQAGSEFLNSPENIASSSGNELILQNVQYFALAKKELGDVNAAMFSEDAKPNVYSMVKEAKSNFHNYASKVKLFLDPMKNKLKELEDLDKDTQFIQSLDEFFELNTQIVSNVENVRVKS